MDFDPRDFDSRDDDLRDRERDRDDEWREPGRRRDLGDGGDTRSDDHAVDSHDLQHRNRGREDDAPQLGRGPSSREEQSEPRDRNDERWPEHDRDVRQIDPRDVFIQELKLPRGPERELVYDGRGREYCLRGSETRTLSTVGAFRVVSARDLRDRDGGPADPRSGDLRHLRDAGLVRAVRLDGRRDHVVVLTDRGRNLLETNRRDSHRDHRQEFHSRLVKPREVEHDAQIHRAYLREAERLANRGARAWVGRQGRPR